MGSRAVVRILHPMRRRGAAWLLHAVLALAAGVFLFVVMSRGDVFFAKADPAGRLFDEGVELTSAARVLAGQVPYRDFALIYAPGQAYTLAALFRLFGESMVVERAYDLVVRTLLCLSVYVLAREVTSSKVALAPFVLATIWLGSAYFYAYAMFPALLCALLSATACLRFLRTCAPRWLFATGALAGIATLYRHDVGLYVVASEVALLILWALTRLPDLDAPKLAPRIDLDAPKLAPRIDLDAPELRPRLHLGALGLPSRIHIRRFAIRRFARAAWPFLAGMGASLGPAVLYLVAVVPLGDLWYAFVAFPLTGFRSAFAMPYPDDAPPLVPMLAGAVPWQEVLRVFVYSDPQLLWALFWTQPIIDLAGLLFVMIALWRCRHAVRDALPVWRMALVAFLAIAFFNQALNRIDTLHLLPSGILACIVLAGLARRAFAVPRLRIPATVALLFLVLVMGPAYVRWPLSTVQVALQWEERAPCAVDAGVARVACVFTFSDQVQAIEYVQQRTSPDEAIFVGNSRHDRIQPNDALFYFIAGRRNATRYDDLVAGLVATVPAQSSIIADLQRHDVRWIVRSSMFDDAVEPNAMGRPTGVTLLDDFIQANYEPVQHYVDYTIWRRR